MQNLVRIGQQRRELQDIPIGQPDPNPRSTFFKKSVHGRANALGLTANEMLDRQERQQRQQTRQPVTASRTISPPPQSNSPSHRMPLRTPERPRPRREPSPEDSPVLVRDLPASTAPPKLGGEESRGKRVRKRTAKLVESRQQGFLPESQERGHEDETEDLYGP